MNFTLNPPVVAISGRKDKALSEVAVTVSTAWLRMRIEEKLANLQFNDPKSLRQRLVSVLKDVQKHFDVNDFDADIVVSDNKKAFRHELHNTQTQPLPGDLSDAGGVVISSVKNINGSFSTVVFDPNNKNDESTITVKAAIRNNFIPASVIEFTCETQHT